MAYNISKTFQEALDDREAGPSIPASPADMPPPVPKKGHIQWFARDFTPGAQDCTYRMKGGSTPLEPPEYFIRYFSASVFEQLAEFTNIYSFQTSGKVLGTTPQEVKVFFGILMAMGAMKYPRIRMYWQAGTRISMVADSMAVNRFFKISQTDPNNLDKFWKVRPILEAVRLRCLQVEPAEENSIDEQMIAFTGRVAAKQFVRNKPNPEGVKVFVRCSTDGGTGVDPKYAHLGLGGSVVMRLVESLPKGQNLSCYFDNYFTIPIVFTTPFSFDSKYQRLPTPNVSRKHGVSAPAHFILPSFVNCTVKPGLAPETDISLCPEAQGGLAHLKKGFDPASPQRRNSRQIQEVYTLQPRSKKATKMQHPL
ncbi:hypothetical protein HPB47_017667 [Ixodes persulcatus]|uniref:Uncharacterized protein n=1 Tax=Ixodes persulcatus TaxID=34615 RepID=A0AC60QMX3_IXOPE|nr:hypothetical protein HPB47_017667 [Ixodes persulcatus]